MTLNQNDLIEFIDQNPGYKALITAVEPPPAASNGQPVIETYKPARGVQRRKRRTKAQIEADRLAQAAE